jgi:hypothetical protein
MALNPALDCSMQFSCWEAGQTKATLVLTKEAAVRAVPRRARRSRLQARLTTLYESLRGDSQAGA